MHTTTLGDPLSLQIHSHSNPLSLQSTLTPVEWKWIWSEGGSRASSESARALFSGFFHFFQLTKKDAGDPGNHQKIQIIIISIGFFDDRQSTVLIYIIKNEVLKMNFIM